MESVVLSSTRSTSILDRLLLNVSSTSKHYDIVNYIIALLKFVNMQQKQQKRGPKWPGLGPLRMSGKFFICFFLAVAPPEIASFFPTGEILPNTRQWTITFNKEASIAPLYRKQD